MNEPSQERRGQERKGEEGRAEERRGEEKIPEERRRGDSSDSNQYKIIQMHLPVIWPSDLGSETVLLEG